MSRLPCLLENAHKLLQLRDSIIAASRGPGSFPHVSQFPGIAQELADDGGELSGRIRLRGNGETLLNADGGNIRFRRGHRHDGFARGKNAIHFAWHDDAFEAALYGNDVSIGCGKHGRNLARGEKIQEADVVNLTRRGLQCGALRSVSDEDESGAIAGEFPGPGEHRVPGAVEAKVAGMQQDETEIAADSADDITIRRGLAGIRAGNIRPVANDGDPRRADSLADHPRFHIFAERDDSGSTAESPAVKPLPNAGEQARLDVRAGYGHIRIEVADVVNEGLALEHGDESTDDALEGRVGHSQNEVAGKEERARNGKRDVRQVVQDAELHREAGVVGRAYANHADAIYSLGAPWPPGAALGRVIGRPAAKHGDFVPFRSEER